MTIRWSVIIVVAVVMFSAGSALVWFLHDAPSESVSVPQRAEAGLDNGRFTSRLDAIDRRLVEIEASLSRLGAIQQGPSQAPIPTRSEAPDFNQLREELRALRDEVRSRMAGLGELQAKNPLPDVNALNELRTRTGDNARLVADAIRGLTYRDLVLQFGSPTSKYAPLTGPPKSRLECWLWETPSGDLAVNFVLGVAIDASFHRSGVMRKFFEE